MVTVNREGFTSLSSSEDARSGGFSLNIIFIHGLRGHPRKTWTGPRATEGNAHDDSIRQREKLRSFWGLRKAKTKSTESSESKSPAPAEVFWPEEYLVPEIPEARIWSYGYNADFVGGFFQAKSKNSVSQHGRDLAVRLEREIENEDPIVFVAHSLGGIVVKDTLHRSKKCRDNTKFIVFLGTPHRGSRYADWAEIASNIARLALQDSNERIVATLEVNSEILENIHEEFKNIVNECGIKVHSFQEAHGISGIKGLDSKVVDDFSSKLDLHSGLETVESIDANHMAMARCRNTDDPRYRAIAGVLRQFVRKEHLKQKPAPGEHVSPNPFLVPFSRDHSFIGREDILAMISVTNKEISAPRHMRTALVGLGGVGKSQIAIEYIYRSRERMPEIAVFWIHASSPTRFEQEYRDIAEQIRIPLRDDPHVNIFQVVCRWLSNETNGPWLMVLDNVDDDNVFFSLNNSVGDVTQRGKSVSRQQPLESFIPQSSNGSILVTSRSSTAARNLVGDFGDIIKVEPMTNSEALALLKTRIPFSDSFVGEARALVQELEGIPLAITHAAAYIRNREQVTISGYLERFRESKANQATLLNYNDAKDLRRDHSTRHPTMFTWQITFEQIRKTAPLATDLMALMSMFDRQAIPECLLHDGTDRLQFEDAIAPLLCFSLIRQQAEGGLFEMHRLVQLSTRHWLESNRTLQGWVSQALRIMTRVFPSGYYDTWSLCQMLVPHSKELLTFETVEEDDILNRAVISTNLGWYLVRRSDIARGETLIRDALKAREKSLGPEHSATLRTISLLAAALLEHGKYYEAESLCRRAFQNNEKLLGSEHLETVGNVSDLASVLERQGKYYEAESLSQRVLENIEKLLGSDALFTLTCINRLAIVLDRRGKYEEAEFLFRRALDKRENILGPEHQEVLGNMNNLALSLVDQGKYEEAEPLYRRALKMSEKVYGSEHSHTLFVMGNLAIVLAEQGRFDEAEPLNLQAVKMKKKALGSEHPDTLSSMNNLASVLQKQGKYDEAESLNRKTLKKKIEVLGSKHPDTLVSMNNLASVLQKQGKYDEAESLNRKTLKTTIEVLGSEHPNTLASMNNLAATLKEQGNLDEAESLNRLTLEKKEKVLGSEHPNTLASMNNLAATLKEQGNLDEAESLNRLTLEKNEKVLGSDHPSTLMSMRNLASTWKSQGQDAEALELMKKYVRLQTRILGVNHPETRISSKILSEWQTQALQIGALAIETEKTIA